MLGLEVTLMNGTRLQTGRRTMKGVTGYDLTSLMVGSEGTLGVISEVTLRLVPKPPAVGTLLALFDHVRGAGARCETSSHAGSFRDVSSCSTPPRSRPCVGQAFRSIGVQGRCC